MQSCSNARSTLRVSLVKWKIHKVDVKSSFLQTVSAQRDVYVVPPREPPDRYKILWLLLTAVYALVNANRKWHHLSDEMLFHIGFEPAALLTQLFVMHREHNVVALAHKIVYYMRTRSCRYNFQRPNRR